MRYSQGRLKIFYILIMLMAFSIVSSIILPLTIESERITVAIVLLFLFISITYILYHLYTVYFTSIKTITENTHNLAYKNEKYQPTNYRHNLASELNQAIFILSERIYSLEKENTESEKLYHAAINNIETGLIFIDSKGFVSLLNKHVISLFNLDDNLSNQKLYYDMFKENHIVELIKDIFHNEEKIKRIFSTNINQHEYYFEIIGIPVFNEKNNLKGIAIVLYDVTQYKQLEKMRKNFVANVSHELKTPVTSIRGFAETLMETSLTDVETRQAFLTIILKESLRLEDLVNELLDLSQIESLESNMVLEKVSFIDLLSEVEHHIKHHLKNKNIVLKTDIQDSLYITANAFRFKQVLINILHNAINASENKSEILLQAHETNHKDVEIKIIDQGIGISKTEQERIFERFYRVDKARSQKTGGTGLGLSIVKHIIEAHHGTIIVESEVGKGSIFIITLPK